MIALHSWCPGWGVGGEGIPILGQYGYVTRESPHFGPLAAPKDSTFSTCAARKDPSFQKIYVSLLFLAPKRPFSHVGQFWKPLIFSKGPLHKPLFLNPPSCYIHIYHFHILIPPPPPNPASHWKLMLYCCYCFRRPLMSCIMTFFSLPLIQVLVTDFLEIIILNVITVNEMLKESFLMMGLMVNTKNT